MLARPPPGAPQPGHRASAEGVSTMGVGLPTTEKEAPGAAPATAAYARRGAGGGRCCARGPSRSTLFWRRPGRARRTPEHAQRRVVAHAGVLEPVRRPRRRELVAVGPVRSRCVDDGSRHGSAGRKGRRRGRQEGADPRERRGPRGRQRDRRYIVHKGAERSPRGIPREDLRKVSRVKRQTIKRYGRVICRENTGAIVLVIATAAIKAQPQMGRICLNSHGSRPVCLTRISRHR